MNVVLRAPALSISGYGVHSRQIFKWLETHKERDIGSLTTQVVQWGDTSWMINPEFEDGLVNRIMSTSNASSSNFDLSVQVQLPDEWDPNLASKNIGISAVVETDKCSPVWINGVNSMDLVIVPSTHAKQCLLNSGQVSTPIHVVPEWYFSKIDNYDADSGLDLNLDTSFNFLMISQFTGQNPENDRKNIYNTIKWFCESFPDDPDVGLILKTNQGRGTAIDRQITKNVLRQILGSVRKTKFPRVHLVHGNLNTNEVTSLYMRDDVKCLLSLTRGEGFGLPLLEAAACGLPVMATNWSGHLDFLNMGKFLAIDYRLCEIPNSRIDGRIFVEGMKWADPIESDFKKKIIKFRNKYDIPAQWARDLSIKVKNTFSESAIIKNYDSCTEGLWK